MRLLFEGVDRSLDAARAALDYATVQKPDAGVDKDPISYHRADVRIKAPIIPKKFFHTAGNFQSFSHEAEKAGFSAIPCCHGLFSSRTSMPLSARTSRSSSRQHLTQGADYELELAVVLKKAGKHFKAREAADYVAGYVIFNDITARDIQREEMKSGVFSFCKAIDSSARLVRTLLPPTRSKTRTTLRWSCA